MDIRRYAFVFLIGHLLYPYIEGSRINGIYTSRGTVRFNIPFHERKGQRSGDVLFMNIQSRIYNGTIHLLKNDFSFPITYTQGKNKSSKEIYRSGPCQRRSVDGIFSLCMGINGFLRYSTFGIHIESHNSTSEDFLSQMAVNFPYTVHVTRELYEDKPYSVYKRSKRKTRSVRFPASTPHVITLFLAVDHRTVVRYSRKQIIDRVVNVMSLVNNAYRQFGIVFVIDGLYLPDFDETERSRNLLRDMEYKKNLHALDSDCFHMFLLGKFEFRRVYHKLTSGEFQSHGGETIGDANYESMCSAKHCVGFSLYTPDMTIRQQALIVAHQLGHNLGLMHDDAERDCRFCIMSPATSEFSKKSKLVWSKRSEDTFKDILAQGLEDCMSANKFAGRNLSKEFYFCGNGIIDPGEQCDCGKSDPVCEKCCDKHTCRLLGHADCATGRCCDMDVCSFKSAGTTCRVSSSVCDLPEYCNGKSEYCPEDVYRHNGLPCTQEEDSYCFNGKCGTRRDRCQQIYGRTADIADEECFNINMQRRHKFGVCKEGYGFNHYRRKLKSFREYKQYRTKDISCSSKNKMCGRLWCNHRNLKTMLYGVRDNYEKVVNGKFCAAAKVDLGIQRPDYGLVPDGSQCGSGMMCNDTVCEPVEKFLPTNCSCNSNGVCNSKGNCHCNAGFTPPDCRLPGVGGSFDSGPPPTNNISLRPTVVVLIILCLLFTAVVGFVIIVCLKKRKALSKIKFSYRQQNERGKR